MQYNPGVYNRSGEIIAAGQMQAAQTNAQMMSQFGSDIGGAIKSIGGDISDGMETRAQNDSAFFALQQMAQMYPSMNKMVKGLSELDPRTRGMASAQVLGNFGALSQFGIAAMNAGVRQGAPAAQAQYGAASQVAAGQGRVTAPPSNINFGVIP